VAQVLRALREATEVLADYYSKLEFQASTRVEIIQFAALGSSTPTDPLHPSVSAWYPHLQEFEMEGEKYKVAYENTPVRKSGQGSVQGNRHAQRGRDGAECCHQVYPHVL